MAKCEQFLRHPVNASCKCFLLLRSREVVCECGWAGADSAGEWWHPGEEGGVISDIMSLVCHPRWQVEDGEYFQTLPENTIFIVLRPGEAWAPVGEDIVSQGGSGKPLLAQKL